jgi:hypothetical protein
MGGKQELLIEEKKSTQLELKPSPIEEAAYGGIDAYGRKEYGKALKLMERANTRCERARSLAQPCANLTTELAFYHGRILEEQQQSADAATQYQAVVDAKVHGRLTDKQRDSAAAALRSLTQTLGVFIVRSTSHGQCNVKKFWLNPGNSRFNVNGKSRQVKIRAHETLEEGQCP